MSDINRISATLSSEEVEAAIAGIKGVEAALPFSVTLQKDERQSLPKVGAKAMEFCKQAYNYADKNPELVPGFIDMAEFKGDIDLVESLQKILDHLGPATGKVKHSISLAKTDCYTAARHIYSSAKYAAKGGVPGASVIAEELGKLFRSNGPAKGSKEPGNGETPVVSSKSATEDRAA